MTAEGQLQCSFFTIFPACSAPPRASRSRMPSSEAGSLALVRQATIVIVV